MLRASTCMLCAGLACLWRPARGFGTIQNATRFQNATRCAPTTWPDKDHNLVCGACKVLVNYMSDKYGGKCSNYCSSIGLRCTGAWEESKDTCTVQYQGKCATSFGTTSDAICQCSAGKAKTPGPTPPRPPSAAVPQGTGTCKGAAACTACMESKCAAIMDKGDSDAFDKASSCLDSAMSQGWHISRTPNACASMDCVKPCLQTEDEDADLAELAACVATCLPERLQPATAPQQVHLAHGQHSDTQMTVSWLTEIDTPTAVLISTLPSFAAPDSRLHCVRAHAPTATGKAALLAGLAAKLAKLLVSKTASFGASLGAATSTLPPPSPIEGGSASYTYAVSRMKKASNNFYTQQIQSSYASGHIHRAVLEGLLPDTTYYYIVGGASEWSKIHTFRTLPSPSATAKGVVFAVIGDLGQTSSSATVVDHIINGLPEYRSVLLVGDLSYADSLQRRWDSWARLVEPLASRLPLMTCPGNHEQEPNNRGKKFVSYDSRQHMPYETAAARRIGSSSTHWYSFNAGPSHVISLNSYDDVGPGSEQLKWLQQDLKAVDRSTTPWVLLIFHAPFYNSNHAHQKEKEELAMKASAETIFYQYGVDLILSGHVHAYERMHPTYKDRPNVNGPTYINIGDGGNREGHASRWSSQPSISAFRKAEYGHGKLKLANSTHAEWTWHRVEDQEKVVTDKVWLTTRAYRVAHGGSAPGDTTGGSDDASTDGSSDDGSVDATMN